MKQEIAEKFEKGGLFKEAGCLDQGKRDCYLVSSCSECKDSKPWPTDDQCETILEELGLVVVQFEEETFIAEECGARITGSGLILHYRKIANLGNLPVGERKQAALAHDEVLVKRFDELKAVIEQLQSKE